MADILQFPASLSERDAQIAQARDNYENIFPSTPPTTDGGRQRILRKRGNYVYRTPSTPINDHRDDLMMDHADNGMPSDSSYCAPDSDPA